MPKRLSSFSPAKKKARKRIKATLVAWKGLMCFPLSSMPMKMGMEPVISMMANITMNTLIISTKLICCKISNIALLIYLFSTYNIIESRKLSVGHIANVSGNGAGG